MIKLKKPPALLVNITLNYQVVGFDIGSHYNFLMTNSICTTVVEVTKNIHDTVIMSSWQSLLKPTT